MIKNTVSRYDDLNQFNFYNLTNCNFHHSGLDNLYNNTDLFYPYFPWLISIYNRPCRSTDNGLIIAHMNSIFFALPKFEKISGRRLLRALSIIIESVKEACNNVTLRNGNKTEIVILSHLQRASSRRAAKYQASRRNLYGITFCWVKGLWIQVQW